MNVDESIGLMYKDKVCEDCQKKIATATSELSKKDMLRPKKVMKRFAALLCPKCRHDLSVQVRKNSGFRNAKKG